MSQGLLRSICGFPGKEKAAKAAEKAAAKDHFLSSSLCICIKYVCLYVYLRICVKCICLFVDLPAERKQGWSS